ncbi:sigma-70 family RNA polymerase sigma factor [Nocardiopsis sp. MG754419]|uniref:sigma-70 family RNA polymerase sigma factor n=1 Tax=Nocardiopsis sp. MG754419 TaxID=2259865 RepID=UPI001BADEC7C|nr:sigma-70 family RNA polymerase sigma factor [Nocardiopsis sp. MG754419]MBR8743759.1 B/F/G family RNA polymerase sigma-70 factor [Nocardiopsis sp. MG754419]
MPASVANATPHGGTSPAAPRGEPSEDASTEDLLAVMRSLEQGDPLIARLRERITRHYLPLLHRIAHRYRGRGEQVEDLRQTAHVGLAKAIRGYSPERGQEFIRYLMPTVTGEIKRHFRDHTWAVHTPRDPQTRRSEMIKVRALLEQRLAHPPTVPEIAREMGVGEQQVEEARLVSEAYNTVSLNAPEPREGGAPLTLEQHIGMEDPELDLAVERATVRPALRLLAPRERLIIKRRFFDEWTQSRIAEELGCSQMHVSRLLAATLRTLRKSLGDEAK